VSGALLLFACWWAPVVILAVVLRANSRRPVFWGWLILAMLVHAVYAAATHLMLPVNPTGAAPEGLWLSRLAGIAVGAALIALLLKRHRRLMARELGLTLDQRRGSLGPSLLGIAIMAALGALAGGIALPAEGTPSLAAIAYHLTLPGLAEEPVYRGLLLSLLIAALGKRPAATFWAAVMANLLFALDHGIFWRDGTIGFNLATIAITGIAGTVLTAMRLRSGSLLPGIVGHNLMGLAGRFA
jgi:hypothetical protein